MLCWVRLICNLAITKFWQWLQSIFCGKTVIVLCDVDLRGVLQVSLTQSFLNWSLFFPVKLCFKLLKQFIFIIGKSGNTDKLKETNFEICKIPSMKMNQCYQTLSHCISFQILLYWKVGGVECAVWRETGTCLKIKN